MKNIIKWLSVFFMAALCIGFISCGDDDDPLSEQSGKPSIIDDFDIGGKWKIYSIDGVLWKTLSYAEDAGYVVFEKDGSYTTRQGGYHLLNLSGNAKYRVQGNNVQIYSNGEVAATFTFKSMSENKATFLLSQGESTKTIVMELQPLVITNTYQLTFSIPSYQLVTGTDWHLNLKVDDDTSINIATLNIQSSTTSITFTTSKTGQLEASSRNGASSCVSGFCNEGVKLQPGEYNIFFPYWVNRSGGYPYIESTNALLTISVLNSETSYDDEEEINNNVSNSYYVQVLLTAANATDISGCTFRYYLGSKEAIKGQNETWNITKSTTLKVYTYVGSNLIGYTTTDIMAADNYSTEVKFYDKNHKLQTGYAFVTSN